MSKLCSDENQNQDQKLETIYINPKILSSMNFPQNTSQYMYQFSAQPRKNWVNI